MSHLLLYDSTDELPHDLESQIRSLLRAEWPPLEEDETGEPLIAPDLHPVYFILADERTVLSYARTIWARVTHLGQDFKLYGLGDVVTAPEVRGLGYGSCVVKEATSHIKSNREADAALLLTEPRLEGFYRQSGWESVPELVVITDEYKVHNRSDSLPMMVFLSTSAKCVRAGFHATPLILPGNEW
jgi:hypothetical protein